MSHGGQLPKKIILHTFFLGHNASHTGQCHVQRRLALLDLTMLSEFG